MILFWSIAAALTAAALLFLLPPLLRNRSTPPDARVAANAAIYREQLEELAAELQRGALTKEEFARGSREIEHRIVAEHEAGAPAPATHRSPAVAAAVVGVLVPVVVVLTYVLVGNLQALDPAASKPADSHAINAEQMEAMTQRLAERLKRTPEDAEGWAMLARSMSVLGRFDQAVEAYARLATLVPENAGVLADWADALAMVRARNLEGEPFELVRRALAIDPNHLKSLALAGSAEFERKNFAAAATYWDRILVQVPADSELAQSIHGSLTEARGVDGARKSGAGKAAEANGAAPGSISGTVRIAPGLEGRVAPGDTLFVFARATEGGRMPLAIVRARAGDLPFAFRLDDSQAMMPNARLSSHVKVIVGARISKSGEATPSPGDPQVASAPVSPGTSGLELVIDQFVK